MNITNETLKQRPLSASSLKEFARSPKHYIHYLTRRREQTDAMLLGSLVHCMILEPDKVSNRYTTFEKPFPDKSMNLKANKEARMAKDADAAKNNQTIVEASQMKKAESMAEAVRTNELSKDIITGVHTSGKAEEKVSWVHKDTGLPMTGFVDGQTDNLIVEVKTARDASPDKFMRDAYNMGYHIQAEVYRQAYAARGRFLELRYIVVENSAPYGVAVYKPSSKFMELGCYKLSQLLAEFKLCMAEDRFNEGYEFRNSLAYTEYYQLDAPGWAYRELD